MYTTSPRCNSCQKLSFLYTGENTTTVNSAVRKISLGVGKSIESD